MYHQHNCSETKSNNNKLKLLRYFMKQRYIFIILGAVGIVFLIGWFSILASVAQNLRASKSESKEAVVVDLTLCDKDSSGLCIVTFGADDQNLMVIHFQSPNADYARIYVKGTNRGTTNMYSCEVNKIEAVNEPWVDKAEADGNEADKAKALETAPTHVYCSGVRTPLGETIDIEVYAIGTDKLIARGTFLISAIAVVTPISLPTETPSGQETPSPFPAPTEDATPTQSEPTPLPTATSTPDTGYPNP
jgi:hypothetical protein